jgi:exo-beta-1,3-glucanase (GH17 family)
MAFFGVCYSPYHRTNTFPPGGVTEPGVDADMQIISRKFTHIRTYGVDGGNQWNVDKATKYKLTLALGAGARERKAGSDRGNRLAQCGRVGHLRCE